MIVNHCPNRIIEIDNKYYLYFGGTAYLGLQSNSDFQQILFKNILQWGTAYGSSRSSNIQLQAYENGEHFLANFIKSEATVTVSSGMLAGKLVLEQLSTTTTRFYHFPGSHTAIKTTNSLPFFINNELNPLLLNSKKEKIILLTDAVPTFCTKPIDLSKIEQIHSNKEITLVIDESHSLGILGANGCGVFSTINTPNIYRKILVASLGKAFGLTGGVIASDSTFINQIKNSDTFISAAGMNAAFVQTIADAFEIYPITHQKLKENLKHIDSLLIKSKAIQFDPEYPLLYIDSIKINKILFENNIIITHFKYPTDRQVLNRVVINSNHQKEDLDKIITVLNQHQF
jgi:7-keto-8-aminopelargonate synthetase-like enzyme